MGRLRQPRKGQLSGQAGLQEQSWGALPTWWTGCAWTVWALGAASGCRAPCPSASGSTEPPLQPRLGARRGPRVGGTKPVLGGLLPFHSRRSGATAGTSQATCTAASSCPFLNLAPKGALAPPAQLPPGRGRWRLVSLTVERPLAITGDRSPAPRPFRAAVAGGGTDRHLSRRSRQLRLELEREEGEGGLGKLRECKRRPSGRNTGFQGHCRHLVASWD